MSSADSPALRERKNAQLPSESKTAKAKATVTELVDKEDNGFSLLDAFRTLFAGALFLGLLSYFVTRDNAVFNQYRPSWTRANVVKSWFQTPPEYTDVSLLQYAGQDPTKPLLLAINGTIYDVSAGRRHYGPGGSYHAFVGADASRAFVTSCFKEDRKPDMRGVEEMFLPFDDPEVDSLYSQEEFEEQKKKELEHAKAQVHAALKHWVDFFANNPKYPVVGKVKREEGWETKGAAPVLCKEAREGRPKRRLPPPGKTVKNKATNGATP